tara:strand:+ start:181 stop:591 length:411 start_codon:yes stop_codon:yes gene_type:complete
LTSHAGTHWHLSRSWWGGKLGAHMTIDKSLYEVPSGKKNKKLFASETGEEEAELDLQQLLKEFEIWKEDNKGGWKDFLKSNKDLKVKTLKDGGTVNDNSYAQLIDDYLDNIEVIEIDGVKESLTHYIKRMGGVKDD